MCTDYYENLKETAPLLNGKAYFYPISTILWEENKEEIVFQSQESFLLI